MTRERIPDFDLYAELEVARIASTVVIEAAFRSLVKQHHPDVAGGADDERIKRLNTARHWLTDPERRRRYDRATEPSKVYVRGGAGTGPRPGLEPDGSSTDPGFGVNAREVRRFLSELRSIDPVRAQLVLETFAAAHAKGYAQAHRTMVAIARSRREAEWRFAREAASVIAKGKLGDTTITNQVAVVVSDVASAIAVRDLLLPGDFDLLAEPWTGPNQLARTAAARRPGARGGSARRETRVGPRTATAAGMATAATAATASGGAASSGATAVPWPSRSPASSSAAASAPGATVRAGGVQAGRPTAGRSMLGSRGALYGAVALIVIVGIALALNGPKPEIAVLAVTDAPTALASRPGTAAESPTSGTFDPAATPVASLEPAASPPPSIETPAATRGPVTRPTIVPNGTPTPRPTPSARPTPTPTRTPSPTPAPTPSPTPPPTPSPTPAPTATPPVFCTVVNLVGENSSNAPGLWAGAGFTGTVFYAPAIPPQYKIGWQSLTVGDVVLCTSDISVQQTAP